MTRFLVSIPYETEDGEVYEYTNDTGIVPPVVSLAGELAYRQHEEKALRNRLWIHLCREGRLWGTTIGHPVWRRIPE